MPRRMIAGVTRMKVRTKRNTQKFGWVGTLRRVEGNRVCLYFATLRDGIVTETFDRKDVQIVKALDN